MATVIEVGNSDGSRRCDAKCYEAKGSECECICGGANHGAGHAGALKNNRKRFGSGVLSDQLELPTADTWQKIVCDDEPLF